MSKERFKLVIGVDEAGRGCERPDAEILTNNGWKFYGDIKPKDRVLSYTHDGFIKWQKVAKIIEKNFEGNLIELRNRSIGIVVTPDHYFPVVRRVFKRDKKDSNRLKLVGYKPRKKRRRIDELTDNDFIPRGGKWKGVNRKFFRLPPVDDTKGKLVDMKLWIAFLGIFLSEGSTSHHKKKGSYKIVISQNTNAPQNRYRKIQQLLKDLPFKFSGFRKGFQCCNKQLYTYLNQFGDCYSKFIPKEIKNLPTELLDILIYWMILGDGSCYTNKNRKRVCMYYTVSKRLKDDFEEILLKAGWTYHTDTKMPRDTHIGERLIKKENKVPCFEVRLRRNNKAIVKHLHKKRLFYKGKVFCLQLLKYHNFYVRRNGTGYFTGNSLAGSVVVAAVMLKTTGSSAPFKMIGLKDSKKVSAKKREEIYNFLKRHPQVKWGIGRVGQKVIDRINILQATKLAMKRAVKNLEKKLGKKAELLLIDGNFGINLPCRQKSIIKGDEKVFSIKLASVVAKVQRDRAMLRYHKKYPDYGFDKHKGYPTKLHKEMLRKYGACKIHRMSFKPVRESFQFSINFQ